MYPFRLIQQFWRFLAVEALGLADHILHNSGKMMELSTTYQLSRRNFDENEIIPLRIPDPDCI